MFEQSRLDDDDGLGKTGQLCEVAVDGVVIEGLVTGREKCEGKSVVRSADESVLIMLVPCVLGDRGNLLVVAVVAWLAQSLELGAEKLPSVVSLVRRVP